MMRLNCCRCCKGLVALTVAAGMMVGVLAGCETGYNAEPRHTGQETAYKSGSVQGQQWNASDGSSGTMSEPKK